MTRVSKQGMLQLNDFLEMAYLILLTVLPSSHSFKMILERVNSPSLRLDYLSSTIGTNRCYLSSFINETLGIDFTNLVSIYRIEEFKKAGIDAEV